MTTVTQLTKENFQGWIGQHPRAIVDFGAEWCGPCKALAPLFSQVAEESKELGSKGEDIKVGFGRVDVEAEAELANQFKIRSLPTMITFRDGKPDRMQIGMVSKHLLEFEVESLQKGK